MQKFGDIEIEKYRLAVVACSYFLGFYNPPKKVGMVITRELGNPINHYPVCYGVTQGFEHCSFGWDDLKYLSLVNN